MSIRQLPDDVVDRLKSSVIITSLSDAVSGLLKNSLDAGATKINISVDFRRGNCTIEDNGPGIPPGEFREDGGLGKLHHTSRFPASEGIHGRHGDFLASLATLSLLSISSHHRGHATGNSVLFHNSNVLARHLPAQPEQALRVFDAGTRIMVRDLFGSMPVRVKQRAVITSDRANVDKQWQSLVLNILPILLSWPLSVSTSVRENGSEREVRFKTPHDTDIALHTSRIFVQASLSDPVHADSWVPISASTEQVTVKGCISTIPSATRRAQFISLGIQPLLNDMGTNPVYEEVNKVFANSSFGISDDAPASDKNDEANRIETRGRKGVDRWPMFYFRIRVQTSGAANNVRDIIDDRSRHLADIIDLLKTVCYGFLKKQHLRPRKPRMSTEESVFSTAKVLKSSSTRSLKRSRSLTDNGQSSSSSASHIRSSSARSESPFDSWQRVKVGHATRPTSSLAKQPILFSDTPRPLKERIVGENGQLLRSPFADVDEIDTEPQVSSRHFAGSVSKAASPQPRVDEDSTSGSDTFVQLSGGLKLTRRPKQDQSEWLKGVLHSWENPVFENAPLQIPQAYEKSHMPGESVSRHFAGTSKDCGVLFEASSINLSGRVSKSALLGAEVIAQVDRKFILVKLPLDGKANRDANDAPALVMLDQHAVDERCQLEDLMAGYFVRDESSGSLVVDIENLEKPLVFEAATQEGKLFAEFRSHFRSWGISYEVQRQALSKGDAALIKVDALPPSILERCRSEPRLLINLLREEIWRLAEGSFPSSIPSTDPDAEGSLVSNFRGCPKGILQLLHSRSCRSAIMFNDVLTHEECEKMVRRVAKCVLPFQCAHGRPSMAPLMDLGMGNRFRGWTEEGSSPDWQRWIE